MVAAAVALTVTVGTEIGKPLDFSVYRHNKLNFLVVVLQDDNVWSKYLMGNGLVSFASFVFS